VHSRLSCPPSVRVLVYNRQKESPHTSFLLVKPWPESAAPVSLKSASSGERIIHLCVFSRITLDAFLCKARPQGFYAKPLKAADGSMNLLEWEVGIPGKEGVSPPCYVLVALVLKASAGL